MSDEVLNREGWLTKLANELAPLINREAGLSIGDTYRLSCGFPARGGTRSKNRTVGVCYQEPDRKTKEIFIHPGLSDALEVAQVALHELLHAALPPGTGHRKPFSQAAKRVGLEGKPTQTFAGEALTARLKAITDRLGPYPHESLNVGGSKQQTRLLKVMCPLCGYIVRVTSKWLEESGAPICPTCSVDMQEADTGEQASDPLFAVEQTVEYKVKALKREPGQRGVIFDPRWSIRMGRYRGEMRWHVIDYGPPVDDDGKAVLGIVQPRMSVAESRQDAVALLEALRDGSIAYADLDADDDNPDLDSFQDPDYLDPNEPEQPDYEDGEPEDDDEYEAEQEKREGWVSE